MYKFKFIAHGKGNIQIDNFSEEFDSDHSYWSKDQYVDHWKSCEQHLAEGKPTRFITSITEPNLSNFIKTWVAYPINDELVFQEHILFLNELIKPFNPLHPHALIQGYENKTEDDELISEWRTSAN